MASDSTTFSNEPLDASDLPQLADERFVPLDPALLRLRTLGAAIALAVAVTATVIVALVSSSRAVLIIGVVVVTFIALVALLQRLEFRHMCYLVREHDLSFRSGVISQSVATVPFGRVQHVSIGRGPLDRRFGLATLQVRTAGGQVAIAGLRHDDAERLKVLVSDRAAALADAELDDDVS